MSPIQRGPHHSRVGSRDTSSEGGAPSKRIPSEQWEAKRGIITQLYQEEKRSLKEVMEVLEKQHGFSATVKMFKSRIWKWGLDKKLKSDEVLAIMVLKRDRDAANKVSEFTIRGQPVDMDNINRYIKRNPQLVARFKAGEVPSIQTTLEVQCHTPSPAGSPAAAASDPPSPPESVILSLLKDYIEESFYTGTWRWEFDVSCTTRASEDCSDELFERMLTSLALVNRCMARGDVISLGVMLDPAFKALRELVTIQSPVFAVRMISLLWYLDTHHKNDLQQMVIDHMASLVEVVLGQHHLLARIWRALAQELDYDYRDFCDSAYAVLVPLLERRIGPANLITTMLHGDHVDFLYHTGRLNEALAMCNEYQAKVDATGRQHPWLSELANVKSVMVLSQADATGSMSTGGLEAQDGAFLSGNDEQAALHIQSGNYSVHTGQSSSAIGQYNQAIHLLEATQGDERLFLASLANLEAAHMKTGDYTEAERIRAVRTLRQDGFASETNELAEQQRRARPRTVSGRSTSGAAAAAATVATTTATTTDKGKGREFSEGLTAPWDASPAASTGEMSWSWSPEVLMSPSSATFSAANEWQFPM